MLAISGSQRVGKSTLAIEFSKISGIPYVKTSAAGTFMRLGKDPKADYPFAERMTIQFEILADMAKLYSESPKIFVTDRAPLDMMAYALADVQRQNMTPELNAWVMEYLNKCVTVSKKHIGAYMILQPGIPLTECEGSAPATPSYMEHINALVVGLGASYIQNHTMMLVAGREVLDIKERLQFLTDLMLHMPNPLVTAPTFQRALA